MIVQILLTGKKGVGKSTILNLFPGENILEIDLDLNEILKKPVDIIELKGIEQGMLRVIDLDELIRNLKSYKTLLESIDIICVVTNSILSNIEYTLETLDKLKQIIQNVDYFIIANFQDMEATALKIEEIEKLLGEKTFGFSAIQKDSRKKLNLIFKDMIQISIQKKKERKSLSIIDEKIWLEIEEARELDIQGKLLTAIKKFSNIASQIEKLNLESNVKQEKDKLNTIFHLCRAWENIALAEEFNDPNKFLEASDHFTQASTYTNDKKLELLALGNSWFCKALNLKSDLDKSIQNKNKTNHNLKIKEIIRKAVELYRNAGFKKEAESIQSTFTYFNT